MIAAKLTYSPNSKYKLTVCLTTRLASYQAMSLSPNQYQDFHKHRPWLFLNSKNAITYLRLCSCQASLRERSCKTSRTENDFRYVCSWPLSCNDFWEIRCVLAGQVTNQCILDKMGGSTLPGIFAVLGDLRSLDFNV